MSIPYIFVTKVFFILIESETVEVKQSNYKRSKCGTSAESQNYGTRETAIARWRVTRNNRVNVGSGVFHAVRADSYVV
jgi:hypothetical protein